MDKFTNSHFNKAPTISKSRSVFDLGAPVRTTFNTGDFICVGWEEVYPGETYSKKDSSLIRLETSLHQTMDNAYLELVDFFIPYRLIWEDFNKFMGANDDPWTQDEEIQIPQLTITDIEIEPQSIVNHLGIPSGYYPDNENGDIALSISALPLRAVFEVWNEFYRDENYDTIIAYDKGSDDQFIEDTFTLNGAALSPTDYESAGQVLRVNRYHDVFSSVLPAPQKGDPVQISLGGFAPIVFDPLGLADGAGTKLYAYNAQTDLLDLIDGQIFQDITEVIDATSSTGNLLNQYGDRMLFDTSGHSKVDLSQAEAITINQLRLAIATQAIKERDARGGTRPKELIYSIWSVDAPDLELDRPEFLGGKRIPINMMEVIQTSETGTTVLGTDAGHSKTYGESDGFIKSFTEYGLVMSFAYVRTARSYSQGIARKFFKKNRFDLYDPMLDNTGEIDVRGKELNARYTNNSIDQIRAYLNGAIGYQECFYWLKEGLAHDSGYFQSGITGTLDSWHYGDNYATNDAVYPNAGWLKETPDQVDRTIAVSSNAGFQWSMMLYRDVKITRMMSKYGIPNTFGFGNR